LKEKSKPLCTENDKSKIKFSKVSVIVILVQVFLYTWVHLILSTIVGMEIAPTTSCAFYTFCGAEAGLLAWIRKMNKQDKSKSEEEPYERDFSSEADQS
jgi:hypothetical protein